MLGYPDIGMLYTQAVCMYVRAIYVRQCVDRRVKREKKTTKAKNKRIIYEQKHSRSFEHVHKIVAPKPPYTTADMVGMLLQ